MELATSASEAGRAAEMVHFKRQMTLFPDLSNLSTFQVTHDSALLKQNLEPCTLQIACRQSSLTVFQLASVPPSMPGAQKVVLIL